MSTVVARLNVFVEWSDECHEEGNHEQSGRIDFCGIRLCTTLSAFGRAGRREIRKHESNGE